jgi:hypothetical protein
MDGGCRDRRAPVAVDVEVDIALEDIEGLGVLAMKMQTEREFGLEIVLHHRIGAARVDGRDFHESVVARPIVVRPAARRHEAISFHGSCSSHPACPFSRMHVTI